MQTSVSRDRAPKQAPGRMFEACVTLYILGAEIHELASMYARRRLQESRERNRDRPLLRAVPALSLDMLLAGMEYAMSLPLAAAFYPLMRDDDVRARIYRIKKY